MAIELDRAALAVDGGGTSCRFALEAGGRRHVVRLGSANVSTDFDGAIATVRAGLDQLAAETGVALDALCGVPAHVGLAGAVDAALAGQVRRALPLRRVKVEDDRPAAVRGALGMADGALAGLGTGSFLGMQRDGAIRLAGGWGSRLGDEASGFWIGREALNATLGVYDGLLPETPLSAAIWARFDGRPSELVGFSIAATPGEIAALAPEVIAAAGAGDPVGRDILGRGAAYIAGTLDRMGWRAGLPLCLLGGVAPGYRPFLPAALAAAVTEPLRTALDGALSIARQLGDGGPL